MEWTTGKIILASGIVLFFVTVFFVPETTAERTTECQAWTDDGECYMDGERTITEENEQYGTFMMVALVLTMIGAVSTAVEIVELPS